MKRLLGLGLRCGIPLVYVTLLAGCGFELRGIAEIPAELIPLYVQAGPGSHIAGVLNEALRINGVLTTDDPNRAHVVVRILDEAHTSRVAAVNSQGKVIGSELHYQVTFDGVRGNGQPFAERQTVEVIRDYVNPEVEVLGKSEEAEMIRRDLEQDMADRILRRLRARLRPT